MEVETIVKILRSEVEEKKFIDIGKGVERLFGVSRTRFQQAVEVLNSEGYPRWVLQMKQRETTAKTVLAVLADKTSSYDDLVGDYSDKVQQIDTQGDALLNAKIDALHGPGAADAIEAAFADGSLFSQ